MKPRQLKNRYLAEVVMVCDNVIYNPNPVYYFSHHFYLQVVQANPYAALCSQMLGEAMSRLHGESHKE